MNSRISENFGKAEIEKFVNELNKAAYNRKQNWLLFESVIN